MSGTIFSMKNVTYVGPRPPHSEEEPMVVTTKSDWENIADLIRRAANFIDETGEHSGGLFDELCDASTRMWLTQ